QRSVRRCNDRLHEKSEARIPLDELAHCIIAANFSESVPESVSIHAAPRGQRRWHALVHALEPMVSIHAAGRFSPGPLLRITPINQILRTHWIRRIVVARRFIPEEEAPT